jgi:hypothetical protein
MPSLEQIAKGAKASGLTQKDFESRILANPRYSGVSREDIAAAWGGGLKKKDQPSGISSPGERMESTESPSLSAQVPAPTRPISVSEVAPSLSRQQGLSDLSKQKPASTKPRGEYDGLARPGRTPVAPADIIATATQKQMTNENELGQVRAFAGRELLNEIANITSKVTDDQAGPVLLRNAKKVDDLYRQFSPDDSGSMFVRDQNGNTAIDPNALNNVFKFADAEVAKGVALKLREENLGEAVGNNATSRLGLSVLEMAFTLPDLIGNLALSAPYYLSRAMTPGFTGEFNPVTTAFGDFADRNRIQTESGEIGKGFGEVRNELSRAEMVTDFGEERANLGIVGNFKEGTAEGFNAGMAMLGNAFVENLPQLAVTAIAPEIGLPMLATMSATQTYNEVLDNKDYSTADKVAYATVMGGIEFLSERILNADIKALRGAITDAGIDLSTKQGKKELGDLMFGKVPQSLRVAIEEPLEEAIVAATGEVMQAAIEGKPINVANIAEGALAGLGAGAGISVLTNGISAIGKSTDSANIIKTQSQIKKLSELMNDPSISEEEKAVLRPKLEQLIRDDKKIRENSADYYSNFTDEDVQETVKLNQVISEGIKNFSKMTTPEAKAEVAANVKAAMEAKKAIEAKYDSKEEQQVPSTERTREAAVEAQPVQEAGRKETPAGRVVQEPKQEVGTVRSLINRKATYSDPVSETVVEGDVYQDGQRVVLETAEGKIFDIGNIDEMQDKSPREFGLMESQERISVNDDGSFVYNGGDNQKIAGGTVMVNRRDGLKSIKRGKDGAIKTVTLTSPDGTQTYNLTGQDAVDAAYQIVLNFSTSPEQSARVEQLLNENEQAKREIQQAARAATEVVTAEPVAVAAPKKAVADTVDVAVGRDGAGVTVAKIATTEEIADRINKEPKKSPVYVATRRAVKSLKKLFPDAEYVFVDSDAEAADYYRQNMPNVAADENGSDKGRIIQNKNNGRIEIVINTSSADATTVYHELFHAAFYKAYAQDAKTAIDFSNRLAKVLDSGTAAEKAIAKRVNDHVAKYKGDPEGVVSEEFLSELAGILAADAKSITQGMAAKIANFINNIAKKIGIGPVFTEAATTKEVVDFMNSFAAAAREGGNVVQDIANSEAATAVFRPSSAKSVKKIDIKETRNGFTRPGKFPTSTKSPFEFANETFITTQSDRLASGEQVLPNGEKITLRGGFGYPAMTNYVWAASELGKAKTLAGEINRQIKEKGYALLAPLVMAESSHKGNYTYFTAAMSLINSAADKKKLSNKKFLEVVKSAAKTAKVDASSVNANTVKENVDILMNLFSVEGGTFKKRSDFIEALLGNTTKKGGVHKPKLPGVITFDQLADITEDPLLKGLQGGGYVMSVIRITKPVKTRNTSASEDGFTFHESYPAIIESTDDKDPGIELVVFDDAFKVEEVFPSIETSTGKIVTLESVGGDVNKYKLYLGIRNIPAVTRAKFIVSATTQDDGRMPADEAVARLDNLSSRSSKLNYDKKGFDSNELMYLSMSNRKKSEIENIIKSGTYAFLTAENPNNTKATVAENEAYMKDAKAWLSSRGYNYTSIYGMYDNKENSFFVPYMTFEDADAFRKEFNQESVAHSDGLIYADYYNPRVRGKNSFDVDYKSEDNNYYSVFRDSKNEVFGVSTTYDDKKSPSLEEGLKKAKTKKETIIEILEESGRYALNDDGKGNFAFFHYGNIEGPAIKGSFFGKNKYTSDKRYYKPVSMYYTRRGESEPMVQIAGRKPHVVLVPKDKVYPFNADPLGFYDEAKKRYVLSIYPSGKLYHLTVENDLHKFDFPIGAQAAFIGEMAKENGYLMIVSSWNSMGIPTRGESQVDLEYDVEATKTYRETNEARIYPGEDLKDIPITDFMYRSSKSTQASDAAREAADQYYKDGGNIKPGTMDKIKASVYSSLFRTPEQMEVLKMKETKDSMISRQNLKIRKMAERLQDLLGKNAEGAALVTEYLAGPNADNISAIEDLKNGSKILDAATEMRALIDQMSGQIVNGPAFAAMNRELKEVILGNMGTYLKTSYRFWKDKKFKVTDAAIRTASEHVYDLLRARKLQTLLNEDLMPQEVDKIMNDSKEQLFNEAQKQILDYIREIEKIRSAPKYKGMGVVSTGQIKIPGESFKQRKDIPFYIQDLLGVEKDPQIRFVDTAIALNNILYKGEMAAKMANAFGNDFFISDDVITKEDRESGKYKQVKDEYSPLNGMWIPVEIFDVVNNEDIYAIEGWGLYYNALKLARKTRVLYNLPTWRKNITGGWQIIMANGILNPQFIKDLANRPAFTVKGKETAEMTAILDEMAQYGLVGTDVNANIINGVDAMYSGILRGDYSIVDKTWNAMKSFDKKLAERYSSIDDYTKMVIYRNKRDSFAKKLFGSEYESLNQSQQEKVRETAAEEVKQTTPTFSRLPPIYRRFAKLPFGDFVSFKIEAVRSLSMIVKTANDDIKKAMDKNLDPVQRKEYARTGVAKLMGVAAAMGASYLLPSMIESALGFEDDETEDVKMLRPNWMSGDNLITKSADANGNVSVYDLTMEDTYGEISSIIVNGSKGNVSEIMKVFGDIVGFNMVVTSVTNLAEGKDQYGRDMFESYDGVATNSLKVLNYLAKEFVYPPFLYSSIRDAGYKAEQTGENVFMLAGENALKRSVIRDYQYNMGQQFYFQAVGLAEGIKKDEQFTNLSGVDRDKRFADVDMLKQRYEAIVRYGNLYGNRDMISSAKSVIKKYYNKEEERYILYGQLN